MTGLDAEFYRVMEIRKWREKHLRELDRTIKRLVARGRVWAHFHSSMDRELTDRMLEPSVDRNMEMSSYQFEQNLEEGFIDKRDKWWFVRLLNFAERMWNEAKRERLSFFMVKNVMIICDPDNFLNDRAVKDKGALVRRLQGLTWDASIV